MKRDLVEINFKKNVFILIVSVCLLFCTAVIGAPDTISDYEVTYGETTVTLQLTREDLRGPHFELLVQQSDGSYDEITPTPERSYIGTVDECPGAVACGILYAWGGFEGAIYHNRGETWWFFHHEVIDVDAAGEASKSSAFFVQWPTSPTVTPDQAGTDMIAFDVGIDALYVYHDLYGGDPNDTFSRIELVVAKVRAQYMKDVLLRPYLGRVIIRADEAASPYAVSKIGWSVVPDHVKGEWDANHTDTSKDTFACFAYTRIGGGLGTVGSIGGSGGSVNGSGDPTVIWRHELGHNWDCGHYVGGSPEGAGLMGGNSPARFTGPEAYLVLAHRDSRSAGVLDNEGAFTSTPLPPYASLDMLAGQEAKTSYTDVLANDHDANGDTLTINTFDSTSRLGGTVSRSVGTGPGGRDELAYTPAAHSITGTSVVDSFLYEVIDPDDQTQTGVAMVYVDAISLAAYWPLDEGTGSSSEDLTANDNDLTISNADNVTWGTGKFDDCLEFDSTSESAYCSSRDQLGSISVSAWVKCDASGVNTWRRAVAQGYYATGWQLGVTSDNKAEFSVTEDAYILRALNGTTTLTAGVWYHLVGVYDIVNDEVRLYVDTDEEDSEAITATSLGHLQSSGAFRIGSCDDGNGFWGSIDDVRLYSHALTLSEINDVFNAEVAASEPDPHDFEEGANVNAVLSWVTSATMAEHDVYIGTNETSVTNATTASIIEYKGRQTATTYNPALSVETTYYWRIDEVNGSGVYTGDVWQFTTGPLLDEPADLDLTNVFKAINFGVTTDQTIGSTVFLASTFNTTVDGVTNTGGGAIASGVATDAVIGDTDDDNALEEILSASVYNGVDIDIPVPAGNYTVQILYFEAWPASGARTNDITIEGVLVADDYCQWAEQGGSSNAGSIVTYTADVLDGNIDIYSDVSHVAGLIVRSNCPRFDVAPVGALDCIVDILDLAEFAKSWLFDGNKYDQTP